MAGDADDSQKTEEPTARKLSKAFEEGNIAKSQDLSTWMTLAAGCCVVIFGGGMMATRLMEGLLRFFQSPHTIDFNGRALQLMFVDVMVLVASIVAIPFGVLMLAGVMGNLVQNPPNFSTKPIEPKLSKINPMKGFGRIFGVQGWINLGKALVKLVAITFIVYLVVGPDMPEILGLTQVDPAALFGVIKALVAKILLAILIFTLVIAVADLIYQRYTHKQKLKMSRKEVSDEHKDMEGDPHVKNKIRQLRREKATARMLENVKNATVVVMNPTHYAVALRYEEGESSAPVCVAKGLNEVALRIRAIAEEHKVTVVENPPLARALHATVEIDEEIPEEQYKAVAEVIGYVFRLRAKAKPRPPRRPQ